MEKLIKKIEKGIEQNLIKSAIEISKQTYKNSEELSHFLRIGLILKEMQLDKETIISGILQNAKKQNLKKLLASQKVKNKIKEICQKTKIINKLLENKEFKTRSIKKWQKSSLSREGTNLRKLFFVLTKDLRPMFILLASHLDKMRNARLLKKEEIVRLSTQSLEIFSPLAYGLGMGKIKGELEDLAFSYLYPKEYNRLIDKVKEKYEFREKYLQKIKGTVEKIIRSEGVEILDIHARAKHYFSLYQKLLRYNMDIEKIYDLVAMRIIVKTIDDCYKTLGAIHRKWKPLPQRIKDYIALPKANGYRSLHTTVVCEDNRITEFQIKTLKMHQEAEYGSAAHLTYKERVPEKTYKEQSWWMDQLRKLKQETKNTEEAIKEIDLNLFKNRVFVLTPEQDIINLPKGSTAVDFAYAIHTEIGDHCQGVKINGKMSNLSKPLETGSIVEIITDRNKTPSLDWLKFVKTQKARSKIKSFLQKTYGIYPVKLNKEQIKEKVFAIKKIFYPKKKKVKSQVLIAGQEQISVKFAKCCQPKPGDKIIAFITKGEGASIHKADCENVKYLEQKWPKRIVQAKWNTEKDKKQEK